MRLKSTEPFSRRFNEWILKRVESIPYIQGDFEDVSFEQFKAESLDNGYMKIDNKHCENNIFGSVDANVAFRAWHDSIHIRLNEGFGYMEETRVAFVQMNELPEDWHEERNLVMCEIIAQAAYHEKYGQFVPNQRIFTVNFLQTGLI